MVSPRTLNTVMKEKAEFLTVPKGDPFSLDFLHEFNRLVKKRSLAEVK